VSGFHAILSTPFFLTIIVALGVASPPVVSTRFLFSEHLPSVPLFFFQPPFFPKARSFPLQIWRIKRLTTIRPMACFGLKSTIPKRFFSFLVPTIALELARRLSLLLSQFFLFFQSIAVTSGVFPEFQFAPLYTDGLAPLCRLTTHSNS